MASKNKKEWQNNTLAKALQRSPERQDEFKTPSGIDIDTVYCPEDIQNSDYNASLGYPGEYPFTRGIQPTMYRGRLWTMRQYAGLGTAEESNKRFHYLLEQGQTGISVAFDLPSQIGYDSDHPLAKGEVGRLGVAIDSLKDMEVLFKDIPLDKVSTSMTVNATAPILLAMYIALAKKQGIAPANLEGTIQNDILKEYVARGTYIFPPRPSIRCSNNLPRWNTISICGYHFRESGSNAAQECAFALADGIAYVQAAIDAGLDVDKFAGRLSFMFSIHNNFFEEIAKLRVARRIWARIMNERFGAKEQRSMMLRTHIQTGGSTLTTQQPMNNIVRATLQALAAALGGVQSMATSCYDEGVCIPTEESQQMSLRIQQILAYEIGITDVVDPLGCSCFIEDLTDKLEKEVCNYIDKIDGLGGAAAAIEQGFHQREIQESAYLYQKDIDSGKQVIIGVNQFISDSTGISTLQRHDTDLETRQQESLSEVKSIRDNARVQQALANLEKTAAGNENTMPVIIECVEAYATLGEICDTLRRVFGVQREFLVF
jgi:methylmalonyl-CoA mutase N-terminal domain/subunit